MRSVMTTVRPVEGVRRIARARLEAFGKRRVGMTALLNAVEERNPRSLLGRMGSLVSCQVLGWRVDDVRLSSARRSNAVLSLVSWEGEEVLREAA